MRDTFKHIQSEYISKTTTSSTICRTIVFALIATVWMFFQENLKFPLNPNAQIALGLLSIYLVLDISQYFVTSTLYGISFFFKEKIKNQDRFINVIDIISFLIFVTKTLYLFVVVILLTCKFFHMFQATGQSITVS